jgi:hypothetical protein
MKFVRFWYLGVWRFREPQIVLTKFLLIDRLLFPRRQSTVAAALGLLDVPNRTGRIVIGAADEHLLSQLPGLPVVE